METIIDYEAMRARWPLRENPILDEEKPKREVLIICTCGAYYRLFVNGNVPIPIHLGDLKVMGISCLNCGSNRPASICGHSAGFFNAMIGWTGSAP